jgi:hypothetical protein
MTNTGDWNTGNHNTGDRNTGNYNTGHCNTGLYNTGDRNIGNRNTGIYNTGDWNTGNRNTGDCNTGNWNTGDCNTGKRNTGCYNTGDYHVGCFNTVSAEKAYYFNKLINKADWDNAEKPDWIYDVSPTTWVSSSDMTDVEKVEHPSYKTTGGYLRTNDLKQEWAKAFANATPEDIELTKALPAFDAEVFLEISGIDLRDKTAAAPCEGREVEIDGVVYVLKLKGEKDE